MMDSKIQPSQIYIIASFNDQGNEDFITDDEAKHNQYWGKKIAITKFMHTSEIVQQVIEYLPNISKHEPCRYVS